MNKTETVPAPSQGPGPGPRAAGQSDQAGYSAEQITAIRTRGKARALARLCLGCEDLSGCTLGCKLVQIHRSVCAPQVGDDFKHCSTCAHTLDGSCPIEQASLAVELHDQLGVCTRKRGFDMPFLILRWDIALGHTSI